MIDWNKKTLLSVGREFQGIGIGVLATGFWFYFHQPSIVALFPLLGLIFMGVGQFLEMEHRNKEIEDKHDKLYVLKSGGSYDGSGWIVEAMSSLEVTGKVKEEYGWAPEGEVEKVEEMMEDEEVVKVA